VNRVPDRVLFDEALLLNGKSIKKEKGRVKEKIRVGGKPDISLP